MSVRKGLLAAVALGAMVACASAEPMRTVFTMENKFPGALRAAVSLGGGGSSYDPEIRGAEKIKFYDVTAGVRFGLTDRVALVGGVPFVGYSDNRLDEKGLGDVSLGAQFLFFEDIFEYAWIIPHATAIFPTGDEDKGLGTGETQGRFGLSVGTTTMDVLHWAADVSYTMDGAVSDTNPNERDDLTAGSLSLIWDLDERASVLGEVQFRDDPVDPADDYAFRGHAGLAYKVNKHVSVMGYVGGASRMNVDVYGAGRVVVSF